MLDTLKLWGGALGRTAGKSLEGALGSTTHCSPALAFDTAQGFAKLDISARELEPSSVGDYERNSTQIRRAIDLECCLVRGVYPGTFDINSGSV